MGDWPSSYGTPSYQTYDPYGLIPETEGQGLPPMSSFRTNGTPVTTAAGSNSTTFGPANHTDSVSKALGAVSFKNIKNGTKKFYYKSAFLKSYIAATLV